MKAIIWFKDHLEWIPSTQKRDALWNSWLAIPVSFAHRDSSGILRAQELQRLQWIDDATDMLQAQLRQVLFWFGCVCVQLCMSEETISRRHTFVICTYDFVLALRIVLSFTGQHLASDLMYSAEPGHWQLYPHSGQTLL